MAVRVDEVSFDTPREKGCAEQLLSNTVFGAAFGLAASVLILTFQAPRASAKVQPLFTKLVTNIVPMTTTASALFTATQCTLDSSRGVRDVYNSAAASAVTGAFVAGVAKKSVVGALVGAGLFAIIGSGPEIATYLSGNPTELAQRDIDTRAFRHSPAELAQSAARTSSLVSSGRLQ